MLSISRIRNLCYTCVDDLMICRGVPERVYPFNKGVCRNVFDFCCARGRLYVLEPLPTRQELEEMSRPLTCGQALSHCFG